MTANVKQFVEENITTIEQQDWQELLTLYKAWLVLIF